FVEKGEVWIYDLTTKNISKIFQTNSKVISLSFSPDGQYIAIAEDAGKISIWDLQKEKLKKTLIVHSDTLFYLWRMKNICYSPDGRYIISGNGDGIIKVWDCTNYNLYKQLNEPYSEVAVRAISFSRNENIFVTLHEDATRYYIKGWDYNNFSQIFERNIDKNKIYYGFNLWDLNSALEFNIYNNFLLLQSAPYAKVLDQKERVEVGSIRYSSDSLYFSSFSPDGNSIGLLGSRGLELYKINEISKKTADQKNLPLISWIQPVKESLKVSSPKIKLEANFDSLSPITKTELFVNNVLYSTRDFEIVDNNEKIFTQKFSAEVPLAKNESKTTNITIKVTNKDGTTSSSRIIHLTEDVVVAPPKPEPTPAPTVIKEKRLALVVGNSNYKNGGNLKNPQNDADSMANVLKQLDFEVIKAKDQTQEQLDKLVREFTAKLKNYDVGLFFYAGHGIELNGTNYIIPVDAGKLDKSDVEFKCINTSWLQGRMAEAGSYNKTNIVILDACRNNPFRSWRAYDEEVWAPPARVPSGLIVAYAASQGERANDQPTESNGLYTSILLKHLRTKGLEIKDLFMRVRVELSQKGVQISNENVTLFQNFYFVK
ncbi:MAG: caspase family protein, partial [Terrimonas sp.]|nr:caspase family protein [Terrimonas sp.]